MTTTTHRISDMLEFVAHRMAQGNADKHTETYHHQTCDSLTPDHHLPCDCDGPADLQAYRDSVAATLANLGAVWVRVMIDGDDADPYTVSQIGAAIEALAGPYSQHIDHPDHPAGTTP